MVQIKVPVSGIDYNLRLFNWCCTHFLEIFYIVLSLSEARKTRAESVREISRDASVEGVYI